MPRPVEAEGRNELERLGYAICCREFARSRPAVGGGRRPIFLMIKLNYLINDPAQLIEDLFSRQNRGSRHRPGR